MKKLLQGKPFKHPLHPFLVHFPIGLFFFSFALDVASLVFRDAGTLQVAAFYSMTLGIAGAFLAAIPGLADYVDIRSDHPAKSTATLHMILNIVAVSLYGLNLGLRYSKAHGGNTEWLPMLLSLAGIVVLSVSGYLGGSLVYDNGIGVGRHRRLSPTPRQTLVLKPGMGPDDGGLIAVTNASNLRTGETLRVKVGQTIIAIAREGDEFFGFQEFCTHRFGPLSEGKIQGGTAECPWHGSCFDMRTGKVLRGPAKVDLKTYQVVVKDETIWLQLPDPVKEIGSTPSVVSPE